MPNRNPGQFLIIAAVLLPALSGCQGVSRNPLAQQLTASQLRSQELFAENSSLFTAQAELQQNIAGMDQERQFLVQQLGDMENQLATASGRIDNLLAERSQLKDRYTGLLTDTGSDALLTAVLPVNEVPGFQYDDLTGLNRFPEAIHFDLGSAELRPEAFPVLKEFANQVNSGGAEGMRVLVVGHTDDQRIASAATAQKHPTNWHLSTDRADQIIVELERLGVEPERIASMGYSRYQPLETGTDETSRQRNRRVELYIVPESANVALWDPARSLK